MSFRWSLVPLVLVAVGCAQQSARTPGPQHPNLVLVVSDALRAEDLTIYGYPRDTSPFLSSLARSSVVFDDHLANHPGTFYSVSEMQTGRFLPPLLMDATFCTAPVRAIPDDLFILPRALRQAGYETAIVTSHPWFNERARLLRDFDRKALVQPRRGEVYAPFAVLAPRIKRVLAKLNHDEKPFYLYIHGMDTHRPYGVHPGFDAFVRTSKHATPRDEYDASISYVDHWMSWLVDLLKKRGLYDNTVFVFTGDHGEDLGEMGSEWWNYSHGNTIRHSQLWVPLLMHLPGDRLAGERRHHLTRHVDLAPTLAHLLIPSLDLSPYRIDGRDLGRNLDDSTQAPFPYSFAWRYWSAEEGSLQVTEDRWTGKLAAWSYDRSKRNYPVPKETQASKDLQRSEERLQGQATRYQRELFAGGRTNEFLDGISLGLPLVFLHGNASYDQRADDDKWFLDSCRITEAAPGERPGPLTLAGAWGPGEYVVKMKVETGKGWENQGEVQFLGADPKPVAVNGDMADRRGWITLGRKRLGDVIRIRLSHPEGGFGVVGFRYFASDTKNGQSAQENRLERRLRALGYVK